MKGPKGILAETIANALAEYFVVDQQGMETHLLSNAAIKLHQTRLQPLDGVRLNSQTTASIRGVVEQVAFEWHWGKEADKQGGSDWVKDVQLRISGLNFTVTLKHDPQSEYPEQSEESTRTTTTSATSTRTTPDSKESKDDTTKKGGIMSYVEEQVQRILDTLTLKIENVLLTIALPDGSQVQLGGQGVSLESQGRPAAHLPLLQRLEAMAFYARVQTGDTGSSSWYPVLEDISYHARIERTTGNRFRSGVDRGIFINGESNNGGIIVHAGAPQIEIVDRLVGMLIDPDSTESETTQSERYAEKQDDTTSKQQQQQQCTEEKDETILGKPSFVQLPLAGVSLILPNGVKLSLNDLMLKAQLDGSMLRIEGKAGFLVDEHAFLQLGETSLWYADIVQSKFCLEDPAALTTLAESVAKMTINEEEVDDCVCCIHARQNEIDKVVQGLNDAFSIYQRLANSTKDGALASMSRSSLRASTSMTSKESESLKPDSSQPAWALEINGMVGVLYESDDKNVEATLHDVTADLASQLLNISCIDRLLVSDFCALYKPLYNVTLQIKGPTLCLNLLDVWVVLKEELKKEAVPSDESIPQNKQPTRKESTDSKAKALPAKQESSNAPKKKRSSMFNSIKAPFKGRSKKSLSNKDEEALIQDQATDGPDSLSPDSSEFVLPIGLQFSVDRFIALKADQKSTYSSVEKVNVKLEPVLDGTLITLNVHNLHHEMIRLVDPSMQLIVALPNFDTIRDLQFGTQEIAIRAGYSFNDWWSLAPKILKPRQKPKQSDSEPRPASEPIKLPYSHIDGLKIGIAFKGPLVSVKDSVIRVPAFDGDESTTGQDLIKFYNDKVVSKIPELVGKTNIMGTNVTDGAIGTIGAAASPFGGVIGLLAFDGVMETFKEGHKSRDPQQKDGGWELGDFSRGLQHAAERATREGAKRRGKEEGEKGDLLDWTNGASHDIVEYSNENKGRLAGAGAGVGGFAAGFAVGGPIGGVVGAVVASAATQKTVDSVDHALKSKERNNSADTKVLDLNPTNPDVFSGMLAKRRSFMSYDWRWHYFVLTTDRNLDYYNTQERNDDDTSLFVDTSQKPRKSLEITINHYAEKRDDWSKPEANFFVFAICTHEQKGPLWVLRATTEEERDAWVKKVSEMAFRDNRNTERALVPIETLSQVPRSDS